MSRPGVNRQWLLAAHPTGRPLADSDFRYVEGPVPAIGDGEVLVRTLMLGFDPAQKGWMDAVGRYVAPIGLGNVVRGNAAGEVVQSNSPLFEPGDLVAGNWGWQDYAAVRPDNGPWALEKLPRDRPVSAALGVLGLTGVTAYFGLLDIGKPVAGDTVVVSGAAGATGSVAGQIAKIAGCRVIGIAGGAEKCAWLTGDLGFDAAIDYKAEDVGARLRDLCPNGIDVFYDNVGGRILNQALGRLAMNARVVICGGITRYQADQMPPGPENYFNVVFMRAKIEGFIVIDYVSRFPEARRRLWQWVTEGRIATRDDVQHGLENAPRTLMRLFEGQNFGKQLLKL